VRRWAWPRAQRPCIRRPRRSPALCHPDSAAPCTANRCFPAKGGAGHDWENMASDAGLTWRSRHARQGEVRGRRRPTEELLLAVAVLLWRKEWCHRRRGRAAAPMMARSSSPKGQHRQRRGRGRAVSECRGGWWSATEGPDHVEMALAHAQERGEIQSCCGMICATCGGWCMCLSITAGGRGAGKDRLELEVGGRDDSSSSSSRDPAGACLGASLPL
jgi:hypothetical protein